MTTVLHCHTGDVENTPQDEKESMHDGENIQAGGGGGKGKEREGKGGAH